MKATEKQKARFREYYLKNREEIRERTKAQGQTEGYKLHKKEYYLENQSEKKRKAREYNLRRKLEVINHYSGDSLICAWCGFNDIRALSIDHINGGGEGHRRLIGITAGNDFYQWLRNNNFPDGYQVLCMNCQAIKRITNNEHYKV